MTRVMNLELSYKITALSVVREKEFTKKGWLKKLDEFHKGLNNLFELSCLDVEPIELEHLDFKRTKVAGYIKTEFIYDFHICENLTIPDCLDNAEVGVMRMNSHMYTLDAARKATVGALCWKFTPIRIQEVV